jgi:hypothetical protein
MNTKQQPENNVVRDEDPDEEETLEFCRELAESGHPQSQINMGNYYREGEVVKRNPRAAFCWYMRAAKQGYWYGQISVADCYFKGNGVKLDYKEAVKWYELAGTNPDKEIFDWNHAALQLAQCYREGLGVKKDLEKASEWYDKAEWHSRAELIRTYGDDADEHDPDLPW